MLRTRSSRDGKWRADVEYVFGDSITAVDDRVVSFERGAPREFDVVVGADGLHSNVRRLVFGDADEVFIGAYLAVLSVPKGLLPDGEFVSHVGPGRMAGIYSARHADDARVVCTTPCPSRATRPP